MPAESVLQMLCTVNYVLNDEKLELRDISIHEQDQAELAARQARQPPASLFYLKGVWSLRNLPPRAASVQINRPYRSLRGSSAASGSTPSYSARP